MPERQRKRNDAGEASSTKEHGTPTISLQKDSLLSQTQPDRVLIVLTKIIRCFVAALVLWLCYIMAGMLIVALSAPAITLTIMTCVLILAFILFLLREWGIAL